jgi:hypothetical protein
MRRRYCAACRSGELRFRARPRVGEGFERRGALQVRAAIARVFAIRMATRNERHADNQRRFNAANERLGELVQGRVTEEERIPFLCECADDRCLGRVELSLGQFEQLHESENVYVIVPGHPRVNGEVILQRQERFEQVEKTNE